MKKVKTNPTQSDTVLYSLFLTEIFDILRSLAVKYCSGSRINEGFSVLMIFLPKSSLHLNETVLVEF